MARTRNNPRQKKLPRGAQGGKGTLFASLECDERFIMSHSARTKKPPQKAPAQVDPLVRDLRGYLLTERKRSPLTVAAYERDLMEFGEFLRTTQDGTALLAVKPTQIRQYIAHMFDGRGYDSRTVCRKLSSIRALYRFLKITGVLENDPAAAIPGPSVSKKRPAPLKVDEVMKLLRTSLAGRTRRGAPARRRDYGALLCQRHAPRRSGRRPPGRRGPCRADYSRHRQGEQGTDRGDQSHFRRRDRSLPTRPAAERRPAALSGARRQGAHAQSTCGGSFARSIASAAFRSTPRRIRCATPLRRISSRTA